MNSGSLTAGLDSTTVPTAIIEQHEKSALLQATTHPSLQMLQQQTLPFSPHLFIQGGNNNNIYNENNSRNGMSEGNERTLPFTTTLGVSSGQQNFSPFESAKNVLSGIMYQQQFQRVNNVTEGQTSNPTVVEEDANTAACSSEDGEFRSGRIRKRRYSMARIQPTRIKKVMQSDEDIGRMVASVPVAIGSAMELFAEKLLQSAAGALQHSSTKTLSPVHIKQAVLCTPHFAFLEPLLREVPLGTNIGSGRTATIGASQQQQEMALQQQIMTLQQQQQFYQQQESSNTNITSNN